MENEEYINCYCFNPACAGSIFNNRAFSAVKLPLSRVLTEDTYCRACGGELISKPILEIRMTLYRSRSKALPAITI